MGDGMLAEFPSVVDAVRAAVETQQAVAERNTALPRDKRIEFRVGINLGDVVIDGDDIHGDGVNVAARLEALADSGGICVSGKVYEEVRDRTDFVFEDLGEQEVKNINRPVRVWRWVANAEVTASVSAKTNEPLPLPDKPSIAVLPFINMSGDPEQEYFSDGVTEDIITELSRFRSLFVISRNSSFTYKGRSINVKEIGRDLGVQYVVEGSVRKAGNRVRITAQLVETATGNHLWAERYDRDLDDIFAVQDEVTRAIVTSIEPEMASTERERARRKPPDDLGAWDYYQRGLWHLYQFTREDNAEAQRLIRQSVELDPGFASAHAELAYVLVQNLIQGYSEAHPENIAEVLRAAQQAVALDDKDAVAHLTLGRVYLLKREYTASVEELETAIALNPSSARAQYSLGFSLTFAGNPEAAIPRFETAIRLSPNDPEMPSFLEMLAWACLQTKRYEVAVEWSSKAIRRPNAEFWAYANLAAALGHLGRRNEAIVALGELLRRNPDFSPKFLRKHVYYNRVPDHLEHYIDGLRKAGLAE
jgi:adenylate cyclase